MLAVWVITSFNLPHQILLTADCSPQQTLGPADEYILREEEEAMEPVLSTAMTVTSGGEVETSLTVSLETQIPGSHNAAQEKLGKFEGHNQYQSQVIGSTAQGSHREAVDRSAQDERIGLVETLTGLIQAVMLAVWVITSFNLLHKIH